MREHLPTSRYFEAVEALEQLPGVDADVVLDRPGLDQPCVELSLAAEFDCIPPRTLREIAEADLGIEPTLSGTRPDEHIVVVV